MRKHVEHESFHHDKLQCKKSVTTVNIKITFTTHFTTIMRKTELSREVDFNQWEMSQYDMGGMGMYCYMSEGRH